MTAKAHSIALYDTEKHQWRHNMLLCAGLTVLFILYAFPSLAEDNNIDDFKDTLCALVDFMRGNVGKGLATIGILILGIGSMMGKISWTMTVLVGIGIAALFSAPELIISMDVLGVKEICGI